MFRARTIGTKRPKSPVNTRIAANPNIVT